MSEEDKTGSDPEQSGSAGSDSEKADKSPWPGLLEGAVKALIPVFLTGASLIGFVAFAGAVIVWTRFDAIGVPPEQVVKAVPRSELVATGSSLLLLFGFFGVLAVLATYLVDRGGRATPGMSRALLLLVALEGVIAIMLTDGVSMLVKVGVGLGFFALVALAVILTFDTNFATYADVLEKRDGETRDARRGPDALHDIRGNPRLSVWIPIVILLALTALGALAAVLLLVGPTEPWRLVSWFLVVCFGLALPVLLGDAWNGIETSRNKERADAEVAAYQENQARDEKSRKKEAADKAEQEKLIPKLERLYRRLRELHEGPERPKSDTKSGADKGSSRLARRRPHRLVLRFWGVCAFLFLAGAGIAGPALATGRSWLAISFAAAFILTAGVWRVAVLSSTRFTWYGLAVFVSVPLFGTCTLMARNVADPQVQPMALIRTTDGPGESIQGIYVTEASDRVYFASIATEGCQEKVTPDSGRLQWVPKSEVVAMSVGPLQDIDKAGRAALEMSNALTPSIETPTGEQVNLSTSSGPAGSEGEARAGAVPSGPDEGKEGGEEGGSSSGEPVGEEQESEGEGDETAEGKEMGEEGGGGESGTEEGGEEASKPAETEGTQLDHRLASAGPAIRPNFGAGLKLVPPDAEPGDVVELRMSAPNTENGVNGFGEPGEGLDLRLNGVRLAVLRVPVQKPHQAEYVKTVGGRVLPVVAFFKGGGAEFVRVDRGLVHSVSDAEPDRGNFTLKLAPGGKLALLPPANGGDERRPPSVILRNGEEEELENVLLHRSWSPTKIKFRVPDNAHSGVVSVECGQLAGQPVLDVVHPPVARVSVRVHPNTERLTFDSSRSSDEGEASPTRVWTVAGRRLSGEKVVSSELPPRLAPYDVSLTISDESGLSDRVDLHVWRLPSWSFVGPQKKRKKREAYERRIRDSLEEETSEEQPNAIELDGHADLSRGDVGHSLRQASLVRRLLFAPRESKHHNANGPGGVPVGHEAAHAKKKAPDEKPLANGGPAVPLLLRAYGESCPILRHPGPQPVNSRVELFLLGPGATIGAGNHYRAARSSRAYW